MKHDLLVQKQAAISLDASTKQREAADPNYSVWVSASAGTGKTKILTDRVLRILLNGVRANRILCITFTKAAAAEMRERVSDTLAHWAGMDTEILTGELQKLTGENNINPIALHKAKSLFTEVLETPGGIRIQTIHSFCQHILERFPREAGVPPNFQTLDEMENEQLLREARDSLVEILLEDPQSLSPEQRQLAQSLRLLLEYKSEDGLDNMFKTARQHQKELHALSALSYSQLHHIIAEYLELDLNFDIQKIEQNYGDTLKQHRPQFKKLLDAFMEHGSDTEKKEAVPLLDHALAESNNPLDLIAFLYTKQGEIRKLSRMPSAKIKKQFPELETFVKTQMELLTEFMQQKAQYACLSFSLAFNHVAINLITRWQQKKLEHMRLSFDDLILYASHLLSQAQQRRWVQYKLDSSIDHILIDEAQDTSPMQWEVLRALYEDFFDGDGIQEQNKRTLFVVGDFKQSIYRFQGARAELFQQMQADFEYRTKHAQIKAKIVDLDINFRSTTPILEFTDALINHTDAKQGVHPHDAPLKHTAFRILEAGSVEVWPAIYPDEEDEESTMEPLSAVEKISETIASRIEQLIDTSFYLSKENRPAHAGDFLILLRRRTPLAIPLIRALHRKNIKTMGSDRLDIFKHMAVQDLLALARFMLQPKDDYSLACALRSPLFDISEDDLYILCHNRDEQSLFARLRALAPEQKNFEQTLHKLEYWRKIVDFRTVFEFFSEILSTGNFERFATRMGAEAEDALTEFLSFILTWEQQNTSLLELFMRSINRNSDIKREQNNKDIKAVRIMTVHGSKGLQAPIVILPDQLDGRQQSDRTGLQLHGNEHKFLLTCPEQPYPDIISQYKEQEKRQELEETNRLLYVATTRAEYKLIVAGFRNSHPPKSEPKNKSNAWYQKVEDLWNSPHAPNYRMAREIQLPFIEEAPKLLEFQGERTEVQNFSKLAAAPLIPLPEYFWHTPKSEQKPYNPLTAGRVLDETELPARSPLDGVKLDLIFNRGNIIHKLLETLPYVDKSQQEQIAYGFLERKIWNLSKAKQDEIYGEVMHLLNHPKFALLFSKNTLAEVPISGIIDDDMVTGRIDRLWMSDEEILIVDFKSNRKVPASPQAVPKIYQRQLEIYKILLQQIYPNKTIRSALLWTQNASLMEMD